MSNTRHVFEFLKQTGHLAPVSTCVVFGPERFLKCLALTQLRNRLLADEGQEGDTPVHSLDGDEALWCDVADELSTMSLFGDGGRRIVIVDDADKFVTKYRDKLEGYASRAHKSSVLVLVLDQCASNTKLYKLVDQSGLQVDCRPPKVGKGSAESIDASRVCPWLIERAATTHDAVLERDAARLLLDLVGPEFGVLDQELAKLAVFAGRGGRITPTLVRDLAGGWSTKTTWDLIDAATEGNVAEAFRQLDQLLLAGQEPIALMGAVAWSLRRFAAATRIFERSERQGKRGALGAALAEAGVSRYSSIMEKAERQLQQIGRQRAARFQRWLLDIDLALKSSHSSAPRARWQLEQLIVRLSRQLDPRHAG